MRTLLVSLCLAVASCGAPQPPLVASEVEVTRPMPGRDMSAGFLILTNNTSAAISITSVTSPQFGSVEIHETTIEDGISRMRELNELVVPARSKVVLERGGKHLMLMRAKEIQDVVTLHLMSGDAPALTIQYNFNSDKN